MIPEQWRVQRIGDLATVGSGGTPSREIQAYWNGTIPWITTSQIDFNTIREAEQFISEDGLKNSAAKLLPAGTLLMALYGQGKTRGKVGVIDFEAATNQACASITVHGDVSREFLLYFLVSRYEAIRNSSNSGGQENLSGKIVKDIPVAIPPASEQRAIAAALSDVDALLSKLDALIAKKYNLKQATIHQLLTGQTRLPGFSGEWMSRRLCDVANLSPGINKPVSAMGFGVLYVTVQDLYKGTSIPIEQLDRIQVSPSELQHYALAKGDIIFGKSSVKRDGIGYPSIFLGASEPAVCTGFSYRVRALLGVADARFLFYALRWEPTRKWVIDNSQASALTNINKKIADSIPIPMPAIEEQAAIAAVLSCMDAEVAALESRRDKTRALKQGMMQELLTGRVRLV